DIDYGRESQDGDVVGCLAVWDTVDFQTKTTASQRIVPLHATLLAILKHYAPMTNAPDAYVVAPRVEQGGKRYRWEFKRIFGLATKPLKRSVSVHMLRHTFGSQQAMAGTSIYKI